MRWSFQFWVRRCYFEVVDEGVGGGVILVVLVLEFDVAMQEGVVEVLEEGHGDLLNQKHFHCHYTSISIHP